MRAILVSGNSQLSRGPEGARGVLSPLVDRPFLQHVVESILSQGVREVDFAFGPQDQAAQAMLGDGTRWGAKFQFHLAARRILDSIKKIAASFPDEHFLLAQADRLPLIQVDPMTCAPTLFCWREKKLIWTGWGVVRTADILCLPPGLEDSKIFASLLENGGDMICEEGKKPLSANSYEDLVDANRRLLRREFPGLLVGGKEIQPGVWVSRNVKVHPSAKLHSPAFLGENSTVGAMVEVGPGASIGKNCVIERDTMVSDSIVFSGSYVGQHLALKGVVVDRSRLINTRWDAEIEGVDELLLGSVFGVRFSVQLLQFCGRIAAMFALILSLPILLLICLASQMEWIPALRREDIVLTPTVCDSFRWRMFPLWSFGERQVPMTALGWVQDFFFCFLPALVPIAAGYMQFVGSKARNKDEAVMATMIHDVEFLYSHTGFLQQSLFEDGVMVQQGGQDDQPGFRATVTVLLRYAKAMIGFSSTTSPSSPPIRDPHHRATAGGTPYEN